MTRDEMIATRLAAAMQALAGRSHLGDDRDTLRRRSESDIDMELRRLDDADAIRDQSQPEREDELRYGRVDYPARLAHSCGGGRRVIRDGRTH